jgi:hypothetical protein
MTEDYKSKYDALMERCAKFMSEFAPPSPYELGFKAGWEAAKQEFDKDNTYVPDTTKPAQTMDIQWPRDKMAWPWPPAMVPTTTPFPPPKYTDHSIPCHKCNIDLAKNTHYNCLDNNCPSQIRWSSISTAKDTS